MSKATNIRIGIASARELELEIESAESIVPDFEQAVGRGSGVFWVTDTKGHRHGVVVERLAFIEVEAEAVRPGVGFAAED